MTVVNRSAVRGQALVELLAARTPARAELVVWSEAYAVPAATDLLVNATSIGLPPDVAARPTLDYATVGPGVLACDVIPAPSTPFLEEARRRGARAVDGLGMLVYQAAIGFELWTGKAAPVAVMRDALLRAVAET